MKFNKTIKPWGYEEILETNSKYTVKRLLMLKGKRCSLQYHNFKKETIIGVKGDLTVIIGKKNKTITPGAVITIEPKSVHRMWAKISDCLYLECSTSQLKDLVRIEDDFGRKGHNEK